MIGSIGSTASTLSVASVLQPGITSAARGADALTGVGDTADISGPGKLFAALKELAAEDPEKFKAVAADIATKLKEAAETASDSSGSAAGPSSLLSDLAAKFEKAAETGDVSVLEPPSQGPGGVGGYDRTGRPNGPPPPPPEGSGVDLKSLFDSITKEVTDALAA
ncbi:hypothetical protein R5W23_000901 [Gemmata sp. JC673]|uniref:Uncharacterized protein n=1 Tax=Gemmata algarum TaxID=2975278 RepID=A0ABU5EWS3_9BACT|nr:hypothetical protein [Gemmata algarum]MDY3559743.1 hypothetical protein [Gemmata algarum]